MSESSTRGESGMRRALTIVGAILMLGGGVTAAVALGAGTNSKDSSTSTATTTAPAKVWVCHHTGSWKHPYHLIHVSADAMAAHMRHGDVAPGTGNSCPTTQPAGAKTHDHGQQSKQAKSSDEDANEAAERDDD